MDSHAPRLWRREEPQARVMAGQGQPLHFPRAKPKPRAPLTPSLPSSPVPPSPSALPTLHSGTISALQAVLAGTRAKP